MCTCVDRCLNQLWGRCLSILCMAILVNMVKLYESLLYLEVEPLQLLFSHLLRRLMLLVSSCFISLVFVGFDCKWHQIYIGKPPPHPVRALRASPVAALNQSRGMMICGHPKLPEKFSTERLGFARENGGSSLLSS